MLGEAGEMSAADESEDGYMYQVEYKGSYFEEATEIGAMQHAEHLITLDVGPVADWAIVHDQVINVWFVQATADGAPIGSIATVTGPEQMITTASHEYPAHTPAVPLRRRRHANDSWLRCVVFAGASPADAFHHAYNWMADRQDDVVISDVGWAAAGASRQFSIKVYYRELP